MPTGTVDDRLPADEAEAGETEDTTTPPTDAASDEEREPGAGGDEQGTSGEESPEEKYRRIARHQERERKRIEAAADAVRAELDASRAALAQRDAEFASSRESLEAANATASELRAQLAAAESAVLRFEVGASCGLTLAQSSRLRGGTAEELKADAAQLVREFAVPSAQSSETPARSKAVDMVAYLNQHR